jgi:hypothetical protein
MADERESAHDPPAAKDRGGPERYPPVNQTDVVERSGRGEAPAGEPRSFDPSADAPTPREGASDGSSDLRHMGPDGDPAEGKR